MSHSHTAHSYDTYYHVGLYQHRYPQANHRVLKTILRHIQALQAAQQEVTVLDYGCGHGRYTLPILESTRAQGQVRVCGYDISQVALTQAGVRLKSHQERLSLFNQIEQLEQHFSSHQAPDIGLLLFGVLSHLKTRQERRELLTWFHQHLCPDGLLILSVPNKWRRFFKTQWQQRHVQAPGDIEYERRQSGKRIALTYHLYTPDELKEELDQCGFRIESLTAESILPEAAAIRRPWIAFSDHQLCRCVPAGLGYGLLVVAGKK